MLAICTDVFLASPEAAAAISAASTARVDASRAARLAEFAEFAARDASPAKALEVCRGSSATALPGCHSWSSIVREVVPTAVCR
jgi:hypothetical protein